MTCPPRIYHDAGEPMPPGRCRSHACPTHAPRCEMCGFRLHVASALFAWLGIPRTDEHGKRIRPPRWPHRTCIAERCPECGWMSMTVQVLAARKPYMEVA